MNQSTIFENLHSNRKLVCRSRLLSSEKFIHSSQFISAAGDKVHSGSASRRRAEPITNAFVSPRFIRLGLRCATDIPR